jgi:processive 1,2-diacylglycerol beta-glucosyltransferase
VRPVLILTAGFGEGHNAASRNIRDALAAAAPALRIEVMDIFKLAHPRMNQVLRHGYLFLINRLPGLWSWVFKWIDKTSVVRRQIGIFGGAARLLDRTVRELDPAVIVTTFPAYNHLLDHLGLPATKRPCRRITVVTDSITINSAWYRCHGDLFFVANEDTAAVLRAAGVGEERIAVTGFPTPTVFASMRADKHPPRPPEKWRVLFMTNSGRKTAAAAAEELLGINDVDLTMTVGHDAGLGRRIEEIADRAGRRVRVLGWTPEVPHLMAESHLVISKAGGATVQEALAARTPMVVSQVVPGQEEGNAQLIERNGAGMVAATPKAVAEAVREAIADGGARWQRMYEAACALSRPDASARIAERVIEIINHEGHEEREGG